MRLAWQQRPSAPGSAGQLRTPGRLPGGTLVDAPLRRRRIRRSLRSAAATIPAVLTAVALGACGGSGSTGTSSSPYGAAASSANRQTQGSPAASSSGGSTIRAATRSLGTILVDGHGRTLYLFKADPGTKSACSGACASAWPPLRVSGKPVVGTGVSGSKLGSTRRSDGSEQVTYNGHPLYTYVGDTKAGDVTGEDLTQFGAAWFALSPAGNQVSGRP
jgi:predicted lipoprotein with Yx(FWY)xxD motif